MRNPNLGGKLQVKHTGTLHVGKTATKKSQQMPINDIYIYTKLGQQEEKWQAGTGRGRGGGFRDAKAKNRFVDTRNGQAAT